MPPIRLQASARRRAPAPLGPPGDWPRPLALLAALLAAGNPSAADPEAARARARGLARELGPDDWARFADLAIERHRVAPVLAAGAAPALDGLPGLPAAIGRTLEEHLRDNARHTLDQIVETRALVETCRGLGAEPLVFKGWLLAERLYGAPSDRHAGDLDLLVPACAVPACCRLLTGRGYRPFNPRRHGAALVASRGLLAEGKDIRFLHPGRGLVVELHWRAHSFHGWPDPLAVPGAVVRQPSQIGPIRTFSDQANMLYLAVHGTLHLWTRLKWLADIAWLAARRGPDGLAGDLEAARALGTGASLALALRLSARLFDSPLPDELVRPGPMLAWAERWMLATMARDDTIPGVTLRYRVWFRLMALWLAANPRQLLGILRHETVRPLRLALAERAARG